MAEAKAPDIGQEADAEGAALRNDADIAGKAGRIAQLLQVARAAMMGAEHPHAVRPAQRNAGFPADPLDPGLQPSSVVTAFGKAAIINDRALHPAPGGRQKGIEDSLVAHA